MKAPTRRRSAPAGRPSTDAIHDANNTDKDTRQPSPPARITGAYVRLDLDLDPELFALEVIEKACPARALDFAEAIVKSLRQLHTAEVKR